MNYTPLRVVMVLIGLPIAFVCWPLGFVAHFVWEGLYSGYRNAERASIAAAKHSMETNQ